MAARRDTTKWEGRTNFGRMQLRSNDATATLTASEESLVLKSSLGEWTLRPGKILHVEKAGLIPWLWRGILIEHRLPATPPHIGFLPDEVPTAELLARLREYGYWVVD